MSMPAQKPGRSKQDYQTPPEFIRATHKKLGIEYFHVDLAATPENKQGLLWFGPESDYYTDSLSDDCDWAVCAPWSWLNPPYGNINPWVRKAWATTSTSDAKIAMLVPASVGSNWWRDWVHNKAHIILLNGRLSFDGKSPFPKDCALLLYNRTYVGGYQVWSWKEELNGLL